MNTKMAWHRLGSRNTWAAYTEVGKRIMLVVMVTSLLAGQSYAASLAPVENFGPNPGELDMFVYIPDGQSPDSALVVALHGCLQQAIDFDDETGLKEHADLFEFVLLLPQQRVANNDKRCFNWFQSEDNTRHRGESASIESMILYAIENYDIDPVKVFVLGLSAGGSMTAVLMSNYPGLFQGGAIIAGTPYNCNSPTLLTGAWWWWLKMLYGDAAAASYACGLFGSAVTKRTPEVWGNFIRESADAMPSRWPIISLWQGDADDVVNPGNQVELLKQWANVHGIDQVPDSTVIKAGVTHNIYFDANGNPRIETYEIVDFNHAIAVDPGTGPEQCGILGQYVKDANICSTLEILKFWGVAANNGTPVARLDSSARPQP